MLQMIFRRGLINCEVTGANEKGETLKVKWLVEIAADVVVPGYALQDNLPDETIEKLLNLKNEK